MSKRNNGQIGQRDSIGGNGQADTFCRTVVAALAAMLALRLCQWVRKWLQG
jgi:tRNA pseudouridine-54 N-methylase